MSRYFFDIRDNRGLHPDGFGGEFDSFGEARGQCQALLADIMCEELPDDELHTVGCDVRDEAGLFVYRGELTFRGARDPG